MIEKAIKFLEKYVYDVLENKNEMQVSYDLWEMHEGVSIYSIACIYAAYEAILKIYDILEEDNTENRFKKENEIHEREKLEQGLWDIKKYVIDRLYSEDKKTFIRNQVDKKLDISLLGLVTPFNMFAPYEKRIINTIESINMNLRTYTGGYLRFEYDHYTEDKPWVIATLWMAMYYIKANNLEAAKECFDFTLNSATKHGFLAEQVENSTMKSVWVIGLAWSHAMFVIVLEELIKLGMIKD